MPGWKLREERFSVPPMRLFYLPKWGNRRLFASVEVPDGKYDLGPIARGVTGTQ
jgi:hypothetical protein